LTSGWCVIDDSVPDFHTYMMQLPVRRDNWPGADGAFQVGEWLLGIGTRHAVLGGKNIRNC
jgi:hypothetical protein